MHPKSGIVVTVPETAQSGQEAIVLRRCPDRDPEAAREHRIRRNVAHQDSLFAEPVKYLPGRNGKFKKEKIRRRGKQSHPWQSSQRRTQTFSFRENGVDSRLEPLAIFERHLGYGQAELIDVVGQLGLGDLGRQVGMGEKVAQPEPGHAHRLGKSPGDDEPGMRRQKPQPRSTAKLVVGFVQKHEPFKARQDPFEIFLFQQRTRWIVRGADDNQLRARFFGTREDFIGAVTHIRIQRGVHHARPEDPGDQAVDRECGRRNDNRRLFLDQDHESCLEQLVGTVPDQDAVPGPAGEFGEARPQRIGDEIRIARPGLLAEPPEGFFFQIRGKVVRILVLIEFYLGFVSMQRIGGQRQNRFLYPSQSRVIRGAHSASLSGAAPLRLDFPRITTEFACASSPSARASVAMERHVRDSSSAVYRIMLVRRWK